MVHAKVLYAVREAEVRAGMTGHFAWSDFPRLSVALRFAFGLSRNLRIKEVIE